MALRCGKRVGEGRIRETDRPSSQQGHQLGLHEGVVVGDVEADDAGALQLRPEAALEFGAVGALHDEDDVGPFHQFCGAFLFRIGSQAGGGGLDAGP